MTADLQGLCEKATPGPWRVNSDSLGQGGPWDRVVIETIQPGGGNVIAVMNSLMPWRDDAFFIARARTAIPELLSTLAGKEAEIATIGTSDDYLARKCQAQAEEIASLQSRLATLEQQVAGMRNILQEMPSLLKYAYGNIDSVTATRIRTNVLPRVEAALALSTTAIEGGGDMGSYDVLPPSASNARTGKED